jgi:hypothetical protein
VRARQAGRWLAGGILALALVRLFKQQSQGLELITAQEARLPDDPRGRSYAVSLGPSIMVVSPSPAAGFIRSPFTLRIRFQSHGGAQIDLDSFLLTYKKVPPIDLTQRVRSFVTPEEVQIDNVEAPAGQHRIQVNLKDSRGHDAMTEFTVKIME